MADPLTPEQADRVRQALKELVPKLGVPPTAKAIGVRPVDLVSLGSGRLGITPEIAQGVADLKKVTLEELLGGPGDAQATVDPLPKRTEAFEIARKDGASEEVIATLLKNPPPGSEKWSRIDWLVAIDGLAKSRAPAAASSPSTPPPAGIQPPGMQAPLPVGPALPQQPALVGLASAVTPPPVDAPPTSVATPMPSPVSVSYPLPAAAAAARQPSWPPTAPSVARPTPSSPFGEAAAPVAAPSASYESVLTIYEYASLTMGLELLPHRADDVYASLGLTSEEQRAGERAHWDAYLSRSPKERRELPAMRERMRMHWLRFDGQMARPSAAPPPLADQAPPPVVPEAPAPNPDEPPVPLITYAAICAELRLTPHRSEDVFAFYGLAEPSRRTLVSEFWETRRRTNPIEDQEFQRLFWEKHQQLEQMAIRTSAVAPMPAAYAAVVAPTSTPEPLALDIGEYALMSVRLEKEKNKEVVYQWFGLQDLTERATVLRGWEARLAADAALKAEWQRRRDEIAADWIDFDQFS